MNVLIPAVSSSTRPDGISRHAANLAQCLLLVPDIERIDLLVGKWQYDAMSTLLGSVDRRIRLSAIAMQNSSFLRNKWYWKDLPLLAQSLNADLIHVAYPVPLRRSAFRAPIVVTLHDLYPYDAPENFGFPKVFFNRAILRQCLMAADSIACVSNYTLARLNLYATDDVIRKAVTIYNIVEPGKNMYLISPVPGWKGEPFLLCVAQHRRNKNIILAIQIFHDLLQGKDIPFESRLIIIGTEGPETISVQCAITSLGLTESVVLLRGITDAELGWCYGHCELLLAPSTVEGFGLPVVEAMHHQCRVVCSDIPVFREICGAYCHYADLQPEPRKSFVAAARVALRSHNFRATEIGCFSSKSVASACTKLYKTLFDKKITVT